MFSEPPHLQLQISPCPEEDRGRVFPGSPGTQPPELTCSLKALDSLTASETLRNNWPRKRSRDKTSLFCVVPPPPPPHPPRKYKGNQGEFLPMISKAKVTVTGWLLPEGSGFWSLWIFFFFFFFFKLMNKKRLMMPCKVSPRLPPPRQLLR